jgi:hypothetical protein
MERGNGRGRCYAELRPPLSHHFCGTRSISAAIREPSFPSQLPSAQLHERSYGRKHPKPAPGKGKKHRV